MGIIREETKEEKSGDHHTCNASCTDNALSRKTMEWCPSNPCRTLGLRPLFRTQAQPDLATTGADVCWNERKNAVI